MDISRRAANIKPSATMALDAKVKQLAKSGKDVINLAIGEPDFGTPENINRAAVGAIKNGFTKYTAGEGIEELRDTI